MINHVMIGSSEIQRSRAFYTAVLGVLGAGEPFDHINATGQTRLFFMHDGSTLCITQPIDGEAPSVANGSTIGFTCNAPEQVQEFHDVAIANGGVPTICNRDVVELLNLFWRIARKSNRRTIGD